MWASKVRLCYIFFAARLSVAENVAENDRNVNANLCI